MCHLPPLHDGRRNTSAAPLHDRQDCHATCMDAGTERLPYYARRCDQVVSRQCWLALLGILFVVGVCDQLEEYL